MSTESETTVSPELRWLVCWIVLFTLLFVVLAIGTGQHWSIVLLAWLLGSCVGAGVGGYFNAQGASKRRH